MSGIDYGMGKTNINHETGIRYGCISQNSVSQAWCDSAEPDYGDPHCPKCGNEAVSVEYAEFDTDEFEQYHHGSDYACRTCEIKFDGEYAFSDEPRGYTYNDEGYQLTDCLDSGIMVIDSPYYTFARFCSPCVPGAGDLNNPVDGGVKTYCLGHDWFENGVAPYPVYSVETGGIVTGKKPAARSV